MNVGNAIAHNIHSAERTPTTIDEIVLAARAGSTEAFAKLHDVYSRRIYKTILTITKNPEDAQDALQDALLRAYLAFHTFEGRSQVYSWLTRIAINSALMILRRRRACPEILFDPQLGDDLDHVSTVMRDGPPDPEELSGHRELRLRILIAIQKLRPPLQGPIRMQITQGLSVREIGSALNLSNAAVKSRLYRARRHLSDALNLKRLPAPAGIRDRAA